MSKMRFSNVILGFGMATLIAVAFFLRADQLFDLRSSFHNPFGEEELLNKKHAVLEKEFEDFFLSSGGFVRVFQESEVDFSTGKKELIAGDIFIAGGIGDTIKIKNLLFDVSEKMLYLSFNERRRTVEAFSVLGNIAVLSEEEGISKEFFTLPHKNYFLASVSSTSIPIPSLKAENAYYTLKESWNIQPWKDHKKAQEFKNLIRYYRSWAEPFMAFSDKFIKNWSTGSIRNIIDTLEENYYYVQSNYSLWFPESKKIKRDFSTMLNPLRDSQYSIEEKNFKKAKKQVGSFRKMMEGADWGLFMKNNPDMRNEWNSFAWAHKIWIASAEPTEVKDVFEILWKEKDENISETVAEILDKLEEVTYYEGVDISQSYDTFLSIHGLFVPKEKDIDITPYLNAGLTESELRSLFGNIVVDTEYNLTEADRFKLTKARRLMTNLLLLNKIFQRKDIYEVYKIIAEQELKSYKDENEKTEIRIEMAYDVFYLIEHFIDSTSEKEIAETLLNLWRQINIEEVERVREQSFLDKEQKELITFVNIAATTSLTEEGIERIKSAEKLEKALEDEIERLKLENEDIVTREEPAGVYNPRDLIRFLEENKVEVDLLTFKTDSEKGVSFFPNSRFYDEKISGEFDYASQRFLRFVVNKQDEYEKIHLTFLPKILAKVRALEVQRLNEELEKQALQAQLEQELRDTEEFKKVETEVLQNTERALLARRVIDNLLKNLGFTVERSNIFVLDEELENFEVILTQFSEVYWLRFRYDKTAKTFSDIRGKYRLKKILGDEDNGIIPRQEREEKFVLSGEYNWDGFQNAIEETIEELEKLPPLPGENNGERR